MRFAIGKHDRPGVVVQQQDNIQQTNRPTKIPPNSATIGPGPTSSLSSKVIIKAK